MTARLHVRSGLSLGSESMARVVCFVTASSDGEARAIGATVVREKLAACANVLGPIASTYWWRGRLERAEETLLLLKTREDLVPALAARVRELHSYEVPEVIAVPILGGNEAYLEWIDASVRPARARRKRSRGP